MTNDELNRELLLALKDLTEDLVGVLIYRHDVPYKHKESVFDKSRRLSLMIDQILNDQQARPVKLTEWFKR